MVCCTHLVHARLYRCSLYGACFVAYDPLVPNFLAHSAFSDTVEGLDVCVPAYGIYLQSEANSERVYADYVSLDGIGGACMNLNDSREHLSPGSSMESLPATGDQYEVYEESVRVASSTRAVQAGILQHEEYVDICCAGIRCAYARPSLSPAHLFSSPVCVCVCGCTCGLSCWTHTWLFAVQFVCSVLQVHPGRRSAEVRKSHGASVQHQELLSRVHAHRGPTCHAR
jgi:hypothetical protein